MMFLSFDHDFIGKLMKLFLVAFTMSSMTYELAIAGRNCFPQAARLFTEREARLMPRNETIWFPESLNSTGSGLLIKILQIMFVIFSLAITVKSNKKIVHKKLKQMLRKRTNAVNPLEFTIMIDNLNTNNTPDNVRENKDDTNTNTVIQPTTSKQVLNSARVTHLSEHSKSHLNSSLTPIEVADKTKASSENLETYQHKHATVDSGAPNNRNKETILTNSGLNKVNILAKRQLYDRNNFNRIQGVTMNQNITVVITNTKQESKGQSMIFKMASSTSAIIIYNFIILQFIFSLKDSPSALRLGYSYFKAVFDTIPLLVILTKGPIYDLVKRRVASLDYN